MSDGDDAVVDQGADEIVVTDKDLYDHAMSNEPAPQASPETPVSADAEKAQPSETPQGQARDEKGRFTVGKAEAEPPKPAPVAPQPQPKPAQAAPQPQPKAEDHRVPLREYLDERGKRQELETKVKQLEEAFNFMRQRGFQPQGQPQAQQPQPLNPQQLFEQPDQYLSQFVSPYVMAAERARIQDKTNQSLYYARKEFGADAIKAAEAAIEKVRWTPEGDAAYNSIMASGLPYISLVEWHREQQMKEAIKANPAAYEQAIKAFGGLAPMDWLKQMQQRWAQSPEGQKAAIEAARAAQQKSPGAQPPKVDLPPSLSSMPSAANRDDASGDLSSESLFRHAMR